MGLKLLVCGLLFASGPGVARLHAQESDLSAERLDLFRDSPEWSRVRQAIDNGLTYLKSKQRTGAIGEHYPVAVTGLSGLAILGAGYHPRQEPHGGMLRGCLKYLRSVADPLTGFITEHGKSRSRMHGHCYAVLFLTQLLGSLSAEEEEDVDALVKGGVRAIEGAQSREGGWYYDAANIKDEDEASVTVCALQALRAARNVGFVVDSLRVKNAIRYVRRCQLSGGSFCYGLRDRSRTTFALSVAALSTLNAAGVYDSPELHKGMDYVRRTLALYPRSPWKAVESEYPFYGNLYAAQTLYQERTPGWPRWYASVRDHLLKKQRADGSWESRYGDQYGTAMALLILEVPLGYLPVFQR